MCVVIGDGSVFGVDIGERKKVGHLKDMIKEKTPSIIKCDADQLTLYIAKKEGNWLKTEDSGVLKLKEGVVTTAISDMMKNEMDPSYRVCNTAFGFPDEDATEDGEIHVLVELPEAAVGVADDKSSMAQIAKQVREIHEQVVQNKLKRYVHSQVGSTKGRELLQDLDIKVDPVLNVFSAAGDRTSAKAFKWGSVWDERGQHITLTEEQQQRERYRAYVEDNIGDVLAEKKLCVIGVEKGQDILTVRVPGRSIELAGRTDLLVLSKHVKENPIDLLFLPEVKMLIEVKRTIKPRDVFQALSELIALDLLSDDPVMALLTDLSNNWQFFWVSEKRNTKVTIRKAIIKDPGQAFEMIRLLIAQPPVAAAEFNFASFEAPVKRRKLAELLPCISEGVEDAESGGIRAAIERYYDVASMLGPDVEMARAVANQVTRSIPAFSTYPPSYIS
ncbi:Crinkler (CRN) family protein [Thraustotheca clavata]|uniref:Crinkler (CRN) family protein n=1 Tax=Thraustotheca clavata TaxID=74557 RepID=A0A1W0A1V8_9STRA|nr:Crinkler (CRN) family protein [Thraustotheca clavata]